jgi:hypothetical protein
VLELLKEAKPKGIGTPRRAEDMPLESAAIALSPVGSSNGATSSPLASRKNTAKIRFGYALAHSAYSSRSCSPVSPTRKKRESEKVVTSSQTASRLRFAGAEKMLEKENPE